MAEEVIVEHAGGSMNGMGAWLLLLVTIVIGVIVGILVLDLVNKAVMAGDTTT
ncbi:MAG: hypothetical protein WA549_06000 [Thermoplasmata archaeon]